MDTRRLPPKLVAALGFAGGSTLTACPCLSEVGDYSYTSNGEASTSVDESSGNDSTSSSGSDSTSSTGTDSTSSSGSDSTSSTGTDGTTGTDTDGTTGTDTDGSTGTDTGGERSTSAVDRATVVRKLVDRGVLPPDIAAVLGRQ